MAITRTYSKTSQTSEAPAEKRQQKTLSWNNVNEQQKFLLMQFKTPIYQSGKEDMYFANNIILFLKRDTQKPI